ncbi:MAG: hypothetical protein WBH84_00700 [Defluviitoga tunisiensis]|jgi:hypothetical protein|uniref:Uncharacterized protein n=1 Tax=Defluviitoga tunisiensis TaxID=1006576 RepID=A0A0C7NQG9_DEFTU|nr:hypothetical protein [Defluviitoga tunisiensis]CEP78137.1 hypothetical protein DTL3_0828 [Defluviitoga tunisiensis]
MPDRTIDKTQGLERAQSKVKTIDIVLILLIFLSFLAVSIWLTLFLNFGKNIENYKTIISRSEMDVQDMEDKIISLDKQIANYIEILKIMEP